MAHPKRKISKTRRDKRRTHYKAIAPTLTVDPQSGEVKVSHRASIVKEGKEVTLYYNGRQSDGKRII